jgi:hypothetical protein
MKTISLLTTVLVLCGSAQAITWTQADFTHLVEGGFSYSASGENVVTAGSAFNDAIGVNDYLGTQIIGGDGEETTVEGNFAMYGLFQYDDSEGALELAADNPDSPLALEFRAWGVEYATGGGENFTLNAVDMPGVDYLTSTFNELGTWGYSEVAPGIWVDIALSEANPGYVAMAVVIENFIAWPGDIDTALVAGALTGPYQEEGDPYTPGSGIRVAIVPEPATLALLGLGGLLLRKRK